ncbi:bifunctional hydroxymethylpyrimidine kinase/phosphomethylpyrimidine kinase [Thioalkalivibrio paradoxus]|uniref:hydroxymethylpyrimidine kinase n=1 Tax=Thioalkalivibrio paradoxus ARh 1 TaxID=713585 RepID=W0DFC8_9GAMM|nr:bifunctional hydroxymethylpyrimidine kinase/phosphomethylpyrimidine kinase [Thioalkalivibrio paradoxus]AHE97334.1 phosphomethylpyrimidine kinase [Thioalkalivibrio paradoxus ARh 1]
MHRPTIALTIAGSDPGGGAGLQADLTTFTRLGVHGATAITAITVQDTRNVADFDVLPARRLADQIEITLADLPVAAIKVGMLGSAENVETVAALLAAHPHIPVVLDPVMVAGGGSELATRAVVDLTRERLLPRATVVTPNTPEAARLSGHDDASRWGETLRALGARNVLITGGHALTDAEANHQPLQPIVNVLYREDGHMRRFELPRRSPSFHGSGCTLAAAITAFLARGRDLEPAVIEAQGFMTEAIATGYAPGRGQHVPNRLCPQAG